MKYIEMKGRLQGKYAEVFKKAEVYAGFQSLDEKTRDEMLMELVDILLTAQKKNTPVGKIIGNDVDAFCRSYFSGFTLKDRIKMLPENLYDLMLFLLIGSVMLTIFEIVESKLPITQIKISALPNIIFAVSGLVITAVYNLFFKFFRKKLQIKNWLSSGELIVMMTGISASFFIEDKIVEVSALPMIILPAVYMVLYKAVKLVLKHKVHNNKS